MSIPYPPGEALTRQEIRELDVLAIEHVGIPGIALMENAGRAAAEFIYGILPNPARNRVVTLCGPGNNGGDGFVVSRHLHNAGVAVHVVLALPPDKSHGDAGTNLAILQRLELEVIPGFTDEGLGRAREAMEQAEMIVDALLGTGSTGPPRDTLGTLVEHANGVGRARRVAIDIPSGLDADSGEVFTPCFRADATVTMVAPKVGFEPGSAREVVGRVVVVDIGAPRVLIPGRE